jgi:phosphoribosylglycinamide formyltransferase-1
VYQLSARVQYHPVMMTGEDPRLVRLTEICLALPEAVREYNGQHACFKVRKKTFAYFLNNHHGDGIVSVTCKVLEGDHTALAAAQPERFYIPAYIGWKGWVALRLDRGDVDWDEVRELVTFSYRRIAPKRLAEQTAKLRAAGSHRPDNDFPEITTT